MHHPAYSCGGYLGDAGVRQRLVPIFERNGVDLVLAGARPQLPALRGARTASRTSSHGGGGAELYSLRGCPRCVPAPGRRPQGRGWLYLHADADSLRVRAIGRWGGVHDDFELNP